MPYLCIVHVYMYTYALCGYTRNLHVRTCRYAAIRVNRPSGISQAAALGVNRTQGLKRYSNHWSDFSSPHNKMFFVSQKWLRSCSGKSHDFHRQIGLTCESSPQKYTISETAKILCWIYRWDSTQSLINFFYVCGTFRALSQQMARQ